MKSSIYLSALSYKESEKVGFFIVILVNFAVIVFEPCNCRYHCVLLVFFKDQYYNFLLFSLWIFFFSSFHVLVCLFPQILIFLLEHLDYDVVIANSVASLSPAFRFVCFLYPGKLCKSLFGSAFLKRDKLILTFNQISCLNFMLKWADLIWTADWWYVLIVSNRSYLVG